MYLTKEHQDSLYEIKRSISNLYHDIDITSRCNVLIGIKQRIDEIERDNIIMFFTCKGDEPQYIGTIKLESEVYVTDPCYTPGIWCSAYIENVHQGVWNAYRKIGYTDWGFRITELIIRHKSYPEGEIDTLLDDVEIGVDSGQAGFFDASYFEEMRSDENFDEWYDRVGELTLGERNCGTLDSKGAVSSSGFGDGGYQLYVHEKDGKIVAMRIVFITKEELADYRNEFFNNKKKDEQL